MAIGSTIAAENLEIWTTVQPKGQRVTDKINYARELLARYDASTSGGDPPGSGDAGNPPS